MEKLINILKENDYNCFCIKERSCVDIVSSEDFKTAQNGYRVNSLTNEPIEDWIEIVGENYYVIGSTSMLGDPILVDAKESNLPVYYIMNEEWENVVPVAKSFNDFIHILKNLDKMINNDKATREQIKDYVTKIDDENGTIGFFENICFDILDEEGEYYNDYN